jgi:uncharacterized delta-60 repeat protein
MMKFNTCYKIFAGLLLATTFTNVSAQSIIPDTTFSFAGIKNYTFYNNIDRGFGCAIQPDQKLIFVGLSKNGSYFELCFARFNVDGTADLSFSGDGKAFVSMGPQQSIGGMTPLIKLQSDGKVVAINSGASNGSQDIMVCRLDSTGVLDSGFGNGGVVFVDMEGTQSFPDQANALDIDVNGNIYVCGVTRNGFSPLDNDYAVIKLNPNGQLDLSFDSDGKKLFNPSGFAEFGTGIKVQTDGKIVFGGDAGSSMMLLRIDSTGALDNTFNSNGTVTINFGSFGDMIGLELLSDGRVVMASTINGSTEDIAMARYNSDGTVDASFGNNGKSIINLNNSDDRVTSMLLTTDNKLLLCGYTKVTATGEDFMITRIDSTGALDLSFNTTGYYTKSLGTGNILDQANSLALMNDGRIMLCGTVEFSSAVNEDIAIMRLTTAGSIGFENMADVSSNIYPNPVQSILTINTNITSLYILYNTSGRVVKSFSASAGKTIIDMQEINRGVYFLKNCNEQTVSKIVKL